MTNFHNQPHWLETAMQIDLCAMTTQEVNTIFSLCSITWRNGNTRHLASPHASLANRWCATEDLRLRFASSDLNESSTVHNRSQFTTESACMLLTFAEVLWLDRSVLTMLQPRSHCGYWWAATDELVERLARADFTFG